MLMIIGVVLVVAWILGMSVFKITKGLIHLVLVVAIILICVHFLRGG